VVLGRQRVLSLSRIRARILGVLLVWGISFSSMLVFVDEVEEMRCGPKCSGRSRKVEMVRLGTRSDGFLRRLDTARLKACMLLLNINGAILFVQQVYSRVCLNASFS